jgi:predicted phage tail protein
MMDVYLHGPLAERFGEHHRFEVRTPRQAASALDANYPGFAAAFAETERWQIVVDGDAMTGEFRHGEESALGGASTEIHFYPLVEGEAFAFASLLGFAFPALATTTIFGVSAATILGGVLFAGIALGLSFLLKPKQPEADDAQSSRDLNYAFSGPENIAQQGVAVPLIYGRNMVGSVVISAGISTDNPAVEDIESGGGAIEDNMASVQTARIVDLLGEGQIKGVVGGMKGVYLDQVAMMNPNGTRNFPSATAQFRVGTRDQTRLDNFPFIETEYDVGVKLEYGIYEVRAVTNADVDQVRFTIQIPQLTNVDRGSGTIFGATVVFRVESNFENTGWVTIWDTNISGKTTSPWYFNRVFVFPAGKRGSWQFRMTRLTPPSGEDIADDIYWSAYTERLDDRVTYAHSAVVGLTFDAHDFSQMPKRTYDVEGLLILVPDIMNPDNGTYAPGIWDGTFQRAYSNNPAWVLFDLIVNNRYGLGDFCPLSLNDRFAFHKAGQWCDGRVPGKGGVMERRYVCNTVINTQEEAYDLLKQMASVFRGWIFWVGNQLVCAADQPEDPVALFTNANVIDGTFNYSGSDIRERHTQVLVGWKDPELLGQGRVAIVEDVDEVERYGIQPMSVAGIGITQESYAVRIGKWELYTQEFESEAIQFVGGMEGAYLRPGGIFKVMDVTIAGRRRGGRVGAGSTATRIYFDQPVNANATQVHYLSCVVSMDDGNIVQVKQVSDFDIGAGGYVAWAEVASPFARAPLPDSIFVLTTSALEATLWRATKALQPEPDRYEIEGVRHFPQKWAYVEKNQAFSEPDISDVLAKPPPVLNLKFIESLVALSAISVGVVGTLSWTSNATRFEIVYRKRGQNWARQTTAQHQLVDLAVTAGLWDFQVTPISSIGIRGDKVSLSVEVIGLTAPPATPINFRVVLIEGVAHFTWVPATELDVIIGGHYELRYSSKTSGAVWNTAQSKLSSIPGNAMSVETNYQAGTWLLRVYDSGGRPSPQWATIVSLEPDIRYQFYHRICENPDFLGARSNTEIMLPQQWLVIGQSGGLWDSQLDDIDSWADVDLLPGPVPPDPPAPRHGEYTFFDRIDLGGPFQARFTADLLAFPFFIDGETIDSRLDNCDDWPDWDNISDDLDAQCSIQIRITNSDPAQPDAGWTEWQDFHGGDYFGRAFEFRALLDAAPGQNIGVEELCITVDLRAKYEEGADVPYPAARTHVDFRLKFYLVPSVVITVQDAQSTDNVTILNKTRAGFDIDIKNNSDVHQVRTFDWHAQGY